MVIVRLKKTLIVIKKYNDDNGDSSSNDVYGNNDVENDVNESDDHDDNDNNYNDNKNSNCYYH